MIAFLEGVLAEALPTHVLLNVHGVGYEVHIPLSSYDRLPAAGQPLRLLTHFHVREDAQLLYGFVTGEERDLFRLLLNHVSGVGPKLALTVLSGMSVSQFKAAVVGSDVGAIAAVRGLGKKTAERIVLELKDKVGVAAEWEIAGAARGAEETRVNDAVLALISLGYKQVEAHKAVRKVLQERGGDGMASEDLVRLALKQLA